MKLCILCDTAYQNEDPAPYFRDWDTEMCWIRKPSAPSQVALIARNGYDVFINLCDGCVNDEEAGIEVIRALEQYNVPFTGAASEFYDPTRAAMKRACEHARVPTPGYIFVSDISTLERLVATLNYPLLVKHPNGHSSIGLLKESRVESYAHLQTQVARMITAYGSALVEEFIDGREFDVLVVENADDSQNPFVYQPAEFIFPPNESFKHYDLKWINYNAMTCAPVADAVLAARLQDSAKKLFLEMNGSGFARCDLRMNPRGEIFMLEINANCGVFYPKGQEGSADFILLQDAGGHRLFIERLISAGLARHARKNGLQSGVQLNRARVFLDD